MMSTRQSVLLPQGTWAKDDDLNHHGGMLVWEYNGTDNELQEFLRNRFPRAEVLMEQPEIPYKIGGKNRALKINIALVKKSE